MILSSVLTGSASAPLTGTVPTGAEVQDLVARDLITTGRATNEAGLFDGSRIGLIVSGRGGIPGTTGSGQSADVSGTLPVTKSAGTTA